MGASTSKNLSSSITKAIAKVSSDIIQKTKLSQDQAQIISVKNIHKDVHISGNRYTQKATINMKSLLDALSKEESQQKILMELAQQAKSITSGLNLAQYADSQNIMNTLIEATVNLLTTISQTCKSFSKQRQEIDIDRIHGNVYMTGNVFNQVYDILQNCSEKAVADSELIQNLTTKLSQSSSATSEGLSGWVLVALLALIMGLPILGTIIGGTVILKFIFPVIFFIGIVLLILYYMNVGSKEVMKLNGFSSLIKNTPMCLAVSDISNTAQPKTSIEASNECLKDSNCKAFDWQGSKIDKHGVSTEIYATTNFYESISNQCMKNIPLDNASLLRPPILFEGSVEPSEIPTSKEGDIYLNTSNGTWYQKKSEWELMGVLTHNFNKILWGHVQPKDGDPQHVDNDVYVYSDLRNPVYFYIYKFKNKKWQRDNKIKGPGLVPSISSINTSGFKKLERPNWMFYGGISCVVIGTIGLAFNI